VKKFWQFTLVGLVEGVIVGWLLSLMSGNYYIIMGVGALGAVLGIVLGTIHRNDP
jgi:hypothetical protein